MTNSRLILIDGNAILHRAFHALPPLTNKKGEMVNAVYGFVSILFRVIGQMQPTHLCVTFDRAKPTFRKKMFADYQAKRPEMDENLVPQIEKVHQVIKAMKIPIFEKDGYEADDVIATLVRQSQIPNIKFQISNKSQNPNSKKQKIEEIIIVTGDRDLLQLVDDKVKLFMPVKGLSEGKLYGAKETVERMGVVPELIPDFKALAGDQSDNYPGVTGIGPKTAVALLNQFGSINNIYKKINQVKNPLIKEKLIKDKDNALMSHKLATVVKDVPVKFDVDKARSHDLATRESIAVFGELGFKTLLKRLLNMNDRNRVDEGISRVSKVSRVSGVSKTSEVSEKEKKQMELF